MTYEVIFNTKPFYHVLQKKSFDQNFLNQNLPNIFFYRRINCDLLAKKDENSFF
tara:strand:+ start:96 stop:257 length:162 start_codon:yes stop_codon:yes gene_type:complete